VQRGIDNIKKKRGENTTEFVLKMAAKYGFMGRYNNKLDYSPFERFQVGDAGLANGSYILGYDIIAHRGYPVYEYSDPKINPDQQNASQSIDLLHSCEDHSGRAEAPRGSSGRLDVWGTACRRRLRGFLRRS
jgi:hypothetical protein